MLFWSWKWVFKWCKWMKAIETSCKCGDFFFFSFSLSFVLLFHLVLCRAPPVCCVLPAAAGRRDLWHRHGDSGPDTHWYLLWQHHCIVSHLSALLPNSHLNCDTHKKKKKIAYNQCVTLALSWSSCLYPSSALTPAQVLSCVLSCTAAARRTTTQQGTHQGN